MASLRWVAPGAATEGVTPLFFPEKPGDLFFLVASFAVSPLISSSQKLTTFFAHRFIAFLLLSLGCHPLVTLHLFYLSDLVSPLFFVNLPTNFFPSGVTPGGCHPGRSPSPPPSDATAERYNNSKLPRYEQSISTLTTDACACL